MKKRKMRAKYLDKQLPLGCGLVIATVVAGTVITGFFYLGKFILG